MIGFSRPFWPLFLHVLGAMTLVGAMFTVCVLGWAAWRRPGSPLQARSAFRTLVGVAVPSYLVMRAGAQWIYSKEGFSGDGDPTWIGIGFLAADAGLLLLLVTTGLTFWWVRTGKPIAGRIATVMSTIYLLLLGIAWLAMSGKWS